MMLPANIPHQRPGTPVGAPYGAFENGEMVSSVTFWVDALIITHTFGPVLESRAGEPASSTKSSFNLMF